MFYISRRFHLVLGSLCMAIIAGAYANTTHSENSYEEIWFNPPEVLLLPEESTVNISWFTTLEGITRVTHLVEDEFVSSVISSDGEYELFSNGSIAKNYTYMGSFEAQANFIGYNKIFVTLYNESNQVVGMGQLKMTVSLSYQGLNDFFTIVLGLSMVFLYVTMGASLDLEVIMSIVKKPIGPIIGLVCQYLLMPLIGFVIGLLLFPNEPLLRLGLFLSGSSPGGGTSNMATHLLGGSLDLSIMMTCVSTIVAFAFLPIWVFSLGPVILQGTDFVIPYKELAVIMIMMIIPCGIGFAIKQIGPRVAKVLEKAITPTSLCLMIFVFSFGAYSYRYIFSLATWKIWLAGFGLPFTGYCSGAIAAIIFKRKFSDVIAIAIETGLQNNTIALLLLKLTLERPAADLTVVIPGIAALMTPVPLLVLMLVKKVYDCRKTRQLIITINGASNNEKQLKNGSNNGTAIYHTGVSNPTVDLSDEVAY